MNGATALSGTPYFTAAPGDKYGAWDMQVTADYMPAEFITMRLEFNHRAASVPYFAGPVARRRPAEIRARPDPQWPAGRPISCAPKIG